MRGGSLHTLQYLRHLTNEIPWPPWEYRHVRAITISKLILSLPFVLPLPLCLKILEVTESRVNFIAEIIIREYGSMEYRPIGGSKRKCVKPCKDCNESSVLTSYICNLVALFRSLLRKEGRFFALHKFVRCNIL